MTTQLGGSTSEARSPPEFVTVDEAAAILRINRKTLYEAIRLGEIGPVIWRRPRQLIDTGNS